MVVGGSQQETLNPGFVLLGTRQQGAPVILRKLVLPGGFDLVSASFADILTSSSSSSSSMNQSIINNCFPIIHNIDLNNKTNLSISLELKPFQYLSLSLFKTLMMMLGEYEHTSTIIEPYIGNHSFQLHYPLITFFFYTTFVFLVPIILMNLLVS
ncbi:unnamed protein product [Schistosoma margrebowiei]|uniref:Uncharacterized protein n=1 Tax=Schistosoma margrebowiei TaxID=48269 RepID=A0A183MR83_9TREM|nr:unnamed protein product [Schistosoma margrebowiei]